MTFKTDSINNMLNNIDEEELPQIKKLIIDKFSISGEILNVDYSEILNFPNIETLYFERCILDFFAMSILTKLNNLKELYLLNCEVIEGDEKLIENLNLETLVIDNTDIKTSNLNIIKARNVTLANVCMPDIKLVASTLNIAKASFQNLNFLNNIITEKLTISYEMYKSNEKIFNNLPYKIIVLEENSDFIYKEVN